MNDEEEVVLTETNPEQPEEQESSSRSIRSTGNRKSLGDRLDDVSDKINSVGKTVENVGKGEEKVANLIDGGEKGINVAAKTGEAASSAAQKGTDVAAKAADARAKASHATAEAAKGAKTATKAGKTAADAADKGAEVGKAASKAMESNQVTGAVGAVGDAASTVGQAAAKTAKAGFTAGEAAAGTAEGAAKAAEAEAKAEKTALNAAKGAEKAAQKGAKAASKATDGSFADKLRKHGKLNQAHGKRLQDLSKKFESDKFLDDLSEKLGVGGKALKTIFSAILKAFNPKTIIIVTTLLIIVLNILIVYILSPMFYIDRIKEGAKNGTLDKVQNFIDGLGFQSSEEAFYNEVNYLNTHYGKELDFSYIMATLYYVDIYYGGSNVFGESDTNNFCDSVDNDTAKAACDKIRMGYNLAKYYLKSANSSTGEDGLVYSSHKLYRLRELAKHQFAGDKTEVSVTLTEYLALCGDRLKNEIGNLVDCIPMLIIYALCSGNPLYGSYIEDFKKLQTFNDLIGLFEGTENWNSIQLYMKNGGSFNEVKTALKNLLEVFFGSFYNIKSVSINIDNIASLLSTDTDSDDEDSDKCTGANEKLSTDGKTCICKKYYARDNHGTCTKKSLRDIVLEKATDLIQVEYYKETYSQDEYENYLVDHYIREMPEFSNLIRDGGKIDEDQVLKIAYQIRNTKELFEELYLKKESAEDEISCIGNLNLDLISELNTPIDLTVGQKITFSGTNIYGLYKGEMHRGVDLEEGSTGTKAGDKVYSLYDGKVISSTVDNTYSDKKANGGWLVIEYTVQYSDSTLGESKLAEAFKNHITRIQVYYGGLSKKDLKLKSGSTVKKGEVIGHVGSAEESETGKKPSLHFAVYDVITNNFLNPTNIFITCKKSTDSGMCGKNNKEKIWTYLLSKGYSKYAAAGIMGNWQRESGFKPYIVQSRSDSFSKKYTADIDNNKMSVNTFKNDKTGGGGYGLAQWTSAGRKEALYKFAKSKGKSIGDLKTQLEFFEHEITTDSYYKNTLKVKKKLNDAKSVDEATKIFLNNYEGGSTGLELRRSYANDIYKELENFECK